MLKSGDVAILRFSFAFFRVDERYRDVMPTMEPIISKMARRANEKPGLRPVQDYAQMREYGSDGDWFSVEFLVYRDGSQVRAFAYVRRKDGLDIPDGEYEVREGEDARRRRWKKWNGKWQVKWRHRWSRKGQ